MYLLVELCSYLSYRLRLGAARSERHRVPGRLLRWKRRSLGKIPEVKVHQVSERQVLAQMATSRIVRPLYKPIMYYSLLKLGYFLGSLGFARLGFRRVEREEVIYWEKGTGSPLLFIHGFGFGVFP